MALMAKIKKEVSAATLGFEAKLWHAADLMRGKLPATGDRVRGMSAAEERAAFWQETKHRMTRRLADWDYCQRAIYMITVTLEDRRGEPLGKLAKNGESEDYIAPTPFGEAVLEALAEMPRIAPQVEIIAEQLMPDHIHFIVFVKAPLARPLGSLAPEQASRRPRPSRRRRARQTPRPCSGPLQGRLPHRASEQR